MGIVAASVHFPGNRRFEIKINVLFYWERIHIGTNTDFGAVAIADAGDNTSTAYARSAFDSHLAQCFDDELSCFGLLEAQFRVGMNFTPPRFDLLFDFGCFF